MSQKHTLSEYSYLLNSWCKLTKHTNWQEAVRAKETPLAKPKPHVWNQRNMWSTSGRKNPEGFNPILYLEAESRPINCITYVESTWSPPHLPIVIYISYFAWLGLRWPPVCGMEGKPWYLSLWVAPIYTASNTQIVRQSRPHFLFFKILR